MKQPLSKKHFPFLSSLLDFIIPARLFARITIASKMMLGYMTLVGLTVIVVFYALFNLQRINTLNSSIVKTDIQAEEAAGKMLDALLAQDTYEKRYLILKSGDMRSLFIKRGREFDAWLAAIKSLPGIEEAPLEHIAGLHLQYNELFLKESRMIRDQRFSQANALSEHQLKAVLDELLEALRSLSDHAKESQESKMKQISEIGKSAFMTTAVLCVVSIVMGAVAGLFVTRHISSSIHQLKEATVHIAEGNFDYDPKITTQDEIGDLSKAFLTMGSRLRKLEEMYLDASPLTRLPGGIAIENVLKKRIDAKQPLAFCVLDLDNFKAFNDRYGYANGSEVIKETAKIIESTVKAKGNSDDFIGHVGGDDFVVITTPKLMTTLASEIISQFDKRIPEFYEPIDRQQGFILGKTRQGIDMHFPIMTISIAIVTSEHRNLANPLEASEIAAELKDYAKTIPKSIYVVDKRRIV